MFRIFFCQFNTFLPNFYLGRWKVAPHVHQATMLAPSAQIKTRKCITPYRTNGRHSQQEISLNNFSFQHALFTEVYLDIQNPVKHVCQAFTVNVSLVFFFCLFCFFFFFIQRKRDSIFKVRSALQCQTCFISNQFQYHALEEPGTEAVIRRCSSKQVLFKIWQISQ